jgi:formylglycine-generating enzyme
MAEKKTGQTVYSVGVEDRDSSVGSIKTRVLKVRDLPSPLGVSVRDLAEDPGDLAENYQSENGMVFVAAGPFVMGCDEASRDEAPERLVTVDSVWIDKFPVTNEDYKQFVDATGHRKPPHWTRGTYPAEHGNHPVTNVSYVDANAYAAWVGKRLPTEAEWEKVARGIYGQTYPWGDAFRKDQVNSSNDFGGATTPVDQFSKGASPYGAWDLVGNVMEWCHDWYDEQYYVDGPSENPPGPQGGQYRCIRGGFYSGNKADVRSAARHWAPPANMQDHIGIRCAKTPLRPGESAPKPSETVVETAHDVKEEPMAPISEDQTLETIAKQHPEAVAKVIRAGLHEDGSEGDERAAVLLVSLGRKTAPEVLKYMTDVEIETVARRMASCEVVAPARREEVQGYFKDRILSGTHLDYGGADYTKDILEKAMGPRKARALMDRFSPESSNLAPLLRLEPTVLVSFLSKEHPQTIALVLSQFSAEKTMAVLSLMQEELRVDVLRRIASTGSVRATTMRSLEEALVREFRNLMTGHVEVGGPRAAAEILKHAGDDREGIVAKLREMDEGLVEEIEGEGAGVGSGELGMGGTSGDGAES